MPRVPSTPADDIGAPAPSPSPADYLMAAASMHEDGSLRTLASGAPQNQALSKVGRGRKPVKVLR